VHYSLLTTLNDYLPLTAGYFPRSPELGLPPLLTTHYSLLTAHYSE